MNESPTAPPDAAPGGHDPYAALAFRDYRYFLAGSVLAAVAMQMQSVAVGWEIYARTESDRMLGLVGLVQVIPVLALTLVAGHVVDRFNRKHVLMAALAILVASSLGLAALSYFEGPIAAMYGCLFAVGVARAFQQPAKASFVPHLVPRWAFPNAVTWNTSGFHLASILGPMLGGWTIAFSGNYVLVYLCDATLTAGYIGLLLFVRSRPAAAEREAVTFESFVAGARFVWRNKILLGAMALDMFAVLLGGAVILLPTYAKQILEVGPAGLGWLRSAPALGALVMAIALTQLPQMERAGRTLLWSIVGFGIATIVFGLSRSFLLSFAMLFLTGAFDNISVVIRHTLVQLLTPDAMRGRVSAVNSMFIGASNELGGFESGEVAEQFGRFYASHELGGPESAELAKEYGPIFSVVSGGIGTLVVVGSVAALSPQLRNYGRLDGHGRLGTEPKPSVDDPQVPATPEENVWSP